MPASKEVHQLLGELAIDFSALEYNTAITLDRLVDAGPLVKPLLIDQIPFSRLIQHCRHAAEYRFGSEPDRLDEAKSLLTRIDETRKVRNWFIHGQWFFLEDASTISVMTFRLRHDKDHDWWEYLNDERTSVADLRKQRDQLKELLDDLLAFVKTLPRLSG